MNRVYVSFLGLFSFLTAFSAEPLPVAWAPLARKGAARQPVESIRGVTTYRGSKLDTVSFRMGDKEVLVAGVDSKVDCNNALGFGRLVVYAGRKAWLVINLGPTKGMMAGEDRLTFDTATGSAVWERPYRVPGRENQTTVFRYRVSGTKDARVFIDYDFGVSQDVANEIGGKFHSYTWCNLNYLGDVEKNVFGTAGERFIPCPLSNFDSQIAEGEKKWNLQTGGQKMKDGSFFHEPENAALRFEVRFPEGSIRDGVWYDTLARRGATWKEFKRGIFPILGLSHFRKPPAKTFPVKGQIAIDLFTSSFSAQKGEPAVGGIDFWGVDALHVPARPGRNLLMNNSFEQGLNYWRWEDGGSIWDPPAEGDPEQFSVVDGGRFGTKALVLNRSQRRLAGICSAAMPLLAGTRYTVSVWARTLGDQNGWFSLRPRSVAMRGNRAFMKFQPDPEPGRHCHWDLKPSDGWRRFSYSITPDDAGLYLGLHGAGVLVDGIQVERGAVATDFEPDPVSVRLETSDPDNDLRPGEPFDAKLFFLAKPKTSFTVRVRVSNVYHETLFDTSIQTTCGVNGEARVALPLPEKRLGEGVFVLRYDYKMPDGRAWTDYGRFVVMTPCDGTHATYRFFCSFPWFGRTARTPHMAKKRFEWGFGSMDGEGNAFLNREANVPLFKKYGFRNIVHPVAYERLTQTNAALRAAAIAAEPSLAGKKHFSPFRYINRATSEVLAALETCAYELARECPAEDLVWTYWNEDEDRARTLGYDEYFKLQHACWKGVKRAFDERGLSLGFTPTHGTSHYFRGRNYDTVDGYMQAANKQGFKYTAISVHPYQNIDRGVLGPQDADVETAHLISRMEHFGYPKETPVYFTECFNMLPMNIPTWGAEGWGDKFRGGQMPTLAAGVRESTHAASLMRLYLLALKYWPKVQLVHPWQGPPVIDLAFNHLMWAKVANTLAKLLPDPKWVGDARPFADVRGYCFLQRDQKGVEKSILAVWSTDHEVELGRRVGPVMLMQLPSDCEAYDMNGNQRALPKPEEGMTQVPLTQAPLFLVSHDATALLKSLEEATTDDPTAAILPDVRPLHSGALKVILENLTKKRRRGLLFPDGRYGSYDIPPQGEAAYLLTPKMKERPASMKMYTWEGPIPTREKPWRTAWFYVDQCGEKPDWSQIPSFSLTNEVRAKDGKPVTLKAAFQAAWNVERLFLRVEAEDPLFIPRATSKRPFVQERLYGYDGCLEVFFDTFADARKQGAKIYDENDARYDFAQGVCHRLRAVNWQLAQGTRSATDEEVRQKLNQTFTRTEKGYIYEIAFDARYLAPIALKSGSVFGFGLYLHDFNAPDENAERGLSLADAPGATCDRKPSLWPLMVLR